MRNLFSWILSYTIYNVAPIHNQIKLSVSLSASPTLRQTTKGQGFYHIPFLFSSSGVVFCHQIVPQMSVVPAIPHLAP